MATLLPGKFQSRGSYIIYSWPKERKREKEIDIQIRRKKDDREGEIKGDKK